jgi:hypothetical protein
LDTLCAGVPEDHCPQPAVADGERFLPWVGGFSIPQFEGVAFPASVGKGQDGKGNSAGNGFHEKHTGKPGVSFKKSFGIHARIAGQ